jgi:hypothetical protein
MKVLLPFCPWELRGVYDGIKVGASTGWHQMYSWPWGRSREMPHQLTLGTRRFRKQSPEPLSWLRVEDSGGNSCFKPLRPASHSVSDITVLPLHLKLPMVFHSKWLKLNPCDTFQVAAWPGFCLLSQPLLLPHSSLSHWPQWSHFCSLSKLGSVLTQRNLFTGSFTWEALSWLCSCLAPPNLFTLSS